MTVQLTRAKKTFSTAARVSALALVVGLGGLTPQIGWAQSQTINAVSIDGNQRVEDGTILTFAGISQGQVLTNAQVNEAAQKIRDSGLFASVSVTARGNTLAIEVVEFPTINQINVEGNSEVRDAELLAVVGSQTRRVYTPTQAEKDVAAIAQVYADKGRINDSVTPRIIERADNRVAH